MFCECISNWYEVYWILKWTKAQEQQNSHKQNNVTYPADCLPNCSPVYLFDFLVLKLGPGNRITYCNEYVFTAVVTTAYSDNDVLYFSVISCEIWLLRNYVGQIGREITWEIVNGHLAVLYKSKPHQLLVHIVVQTYLGCALAVSNNCCRIYDY